MTDVHDEPTPEPSPETEQASQGGSRLKGRLIKWAFYAAIVVAFGWVILEIDWSELEGVEVSPEWLVGATVLALAFRYLGVIVWRRVLVHLGAEDLPSFRTMADVYAKAWLARYIPGTIPWLAGKVYMASQHGISKSKLAVSTLVEAAAQIVAVGTVSLLMLAIDPRIGEVSPVLRILVAIGALAGLVAMSPPVFNRILALGFRLMKRGTPAPVGWRLVSDALALYAGGALVSGASFALMVRAVVPDVQMSDMLFLIGSFGLSGVIGMLTPLVPSGLGTKDFSQMALLLIIVPAPVAAIVVIVSRVWAATVDVLFWAVAWSIERLRVGVRRPQS